MKNCQMFLGRSTLVMILAASGASIFFSQNCARVKVSQSSAVVSNDKILSESTNGNGEPYDPKLDTGSFYRVTPRSYCGSKQAWQKIDLTATGSARLTGFDLKSCQEYNLEVDPADLTFTRDRQNLSHENAIFEKHEVAPDITKPEIEMTELWCRDADTKNIEFVIVGSTTLQKYSLSVNAGAEATKTELNRILQAGVLSFESRQESTTKFSLQLLEKIGADQRGPISAQFRGSLANLSKDIKLTCLVGGPLDNMDLPPAESPVLACPANFLFVPESSGLTNTSDVCVAKYEAKQDQNRAQSIPQGLPWNQISRDNAIVACRANGPQYDLIANKEWQSVARSIEAVPENWDTNSDRTGLLNVGHIDGAPASALAASADDNDSCFGTGQTCSLAIWNSQRRTHRLSSGEIIWDIGGNLEEWVSDQPTQVWGPDSPIALLTNQTPYLMGAKDMFGPFGDFGSLLSPYGNLGQAIFSNPLGTAISRGGRYSNGGSLPGIFNLDMNLNGAPRNQTTFRCVFRP